jgi:site-specific DNA recombinase
VLSGYMVWNRRAMKTRIGSPNPMEKWVWSKEPTHEKIIDLEDFVAAQQVVRRRERSRTQAGANTHPQTKRTYRLRSYLFCELCGRRMFGRRVASTRTTHALRRRAMSPMDTRTACGCAKSRRNLSSSVRKVEN